MSSLPWFRLYHRMIDDDKLRLLAFEDRWHFVALCCLKADGLLNSDRDHLWQRKVAVKMGVQVRELEEIARRLQEVGLIDEDLSPISWDNLQKRSDASAERVKRHRQKRKEMGLVQQWQPSKELRLSVYARDGGACVYCQNTTDLTLDHKVPEIRGGDNSFENLQTCCRSCNASKRDMTHDEFLERRNGVTVTLRKPARVEEDKDGEGETELSPNGDCSSDNELKPEHVAKKWNEIAVSIGLRPIRDLTPERRQLVRARIAQYGIDDFVEVFGKVAASPFLRGERNWRGATFDWVMKKANFQKILEGNYDD